MDLDWKSAEVERVIGIDKTLSTKYYFSQVKILALERNASSVVPGSEL